MKSLLSVVQAALLKGGVQANDPKLVDLLSRTELDKITIPEELTTAIESLMSEEAARNNPKVKAHFRQNILESMDSKLHDLASELGISGAELEAITKEKNSYAKPDLLKAQMIKQLEAAKKTAKADGDLDKVASLTKTIGELNAQLAQEKQARQDDVNREKQARLDFIRDQAVRSEAAGQKWSEAIPEDSRVDLYNIQLNKRLAAMEAQLVVDEQGNVSLKTKDGSDYFDPTNNTKVDFKTLSAKIMADNKFLAVSAPAGTGQTGSNSQTQTVVQGQNPGQATAPQNLALQQRQAAAMESLKAFQAGQQPQ